MLDGYLSTVAPRGVGPSQLISQIAGFRQGPLTWEHTFVTSEGHPYAVLQRSLKNGNLWVAEAVARDMPHVPLEDALRLVYLYAEKESPKYERAAMKFLRRYLDEKEPTLKIFAKVVRQLQQSQLELPERGFGEPREREATGSCRLTGLRCAQASRVFPQASRWSLSPPSVGPPVRVR